jgi:hypothetical protein
MAPYNEQDVDELIKEVYAQFGLAYYESECLHRELCMILAFNSSQNKLNITRPRIEEKLVDAFSLTLGQVKDSLKNILPNELYLKLEDAVKRRNFLAHHFWFDRIHLMLSIKGLRQMLEELSILTESFSKLDELVSNYSKSKLHQFGLTEEMLQKSLNEIISGKPPEPLLRKRKLKKEERLIRVWECKLPNGTSPLIFETQDNCLWQLCDVGLGWTYFDRIDTHWKENKTIQPYLPANINPRPKDCHPWEYEFRLSKSAILWVKPGSQERSFKWGIRTNP